MVTRVATVAFLGIEAVPVDVQVQMSPGKPGFVLVGLPDKAVKESSERVRAALQASGLGMPPKRITVNLAPADLPKEGRIFTCQKMHVLKAVTMTSPSLWASWPPSGPFRRTGWTTIWRWANWGWTGVWPMSAACCRRRSPRRAAISA